jgi:hypothetical protein
VYRPRRQGSAKRRTRAIATEPPRRARAPRRTDVPIAHHPGPLYSARPWW